MAVEIPVVINIDKAFEDAAKKAEVALLPLQKTIEGLTSDLTAWREILNESKINSKDFIEAAKNIHNISESLAEAEYAMKKYTENEGSIRSMTTSLAELERRWAEMGNAQKYDVTGAYSEQAYDLLEQYAKITAELQKQGKSLSELAAKEALRVKNAQRDAQQRKYENAVLSSTAKTIRGLREQERILSERLSRTTIGSEKYKELVVALQKVRREMTKVQASIVGTESSANKMNDAIGRSKKEFEGVNGELGISNNRMVSLIKNSIRLIALHTATRFIRNVRDVTAEFELQRVALGSIIQDTEKAESLFKQIKAAAIQSPFEIKDLVTYTKQLSAYQIETEKLFDTTMKLADISAGLGVDMGRLILAFGQVRAAAVLRGQELRQFTEAGIPLVDKLAQKFSDLNNRAVSTAEVFELISKRAVPFSMIEEIFNDLTSAGGAFYKMQEKQAETLLGQWNNLKDAVSIMYDEIGNTTVVHSAMEDLIRSARTVMLNWRVIAKTIGGVILQFASLKVVTAFLPILTRNTKLLEKAELSLTRAKTLQNAALSTGNKLMMISAKSLRAYTYYTILAGRATTGFGRALNLVKAFFAKNWIGLAVTAVTLLTSALIAARQESQRLKKELAQIGAEGGIKADQSARNFERLAKAAVSAASGSKEQKAAIDELVRTYGDILPASDKVLEKLISMKGNYDSLTEAIRQKINMQIREQKIDTITSEYGKDIGNKQDRLKKLLKRQGLSTEEISVVMEQLQEAVNDGLVNVEQDVLGQAKAIEKIIYTYTGKIVDITKSAYSQVAGTTEKIYLGEKPTELSRTLRSLVGLWSGMNDAIQEVNASMASSTGVIGKYANEWEEAQKEIAKYSGVGTSSFARNEDEIRNRVEKSIKFIKDKFEEANIDISQAIVNGVPNFDILQGLTNQIKDSSAAASLRSIVKDFQKAYEKLELSDDLRNAIKSKLVDISTSTKISMDKFTSYIKAAGADSNKYLQELEESITSYRNSAQELSNLIAQGYSPANTAENRAKIEEYNGMANALQVLYDWLSKIIVQMSKSTKKDPLTGLRENINDITNAYKKYIELLKYQSKAAALADISVLFPSLKGAEPSFDYVEKELNKLLEKYKGNAKATSIIEQALTNIRFDRLKDNLEEQLKKVSDELKRSETARNFFQNILDLTGDEDLAATMTVSVYGGIGDEFKERMQSQLNAALAHIDTNNIDLWSRIWEAGQKQDFSVILANLDKFPEEWQKRLKQMAEDSQKFQADREADLIKALQGAKSYADKAVEINRKAQQRLAQIDELKADDATKERLRKQNADKEAAELQQLQYEAFKETPMYIELFANLDTASERMLKSMRQNLVQMKSEWKDLTPTELKELQSRIEELDAQIASRNPFKALISSIKEYRDMTQNLSRREAEEAAISATDYANLQKESLQAALDEYNLAVKTYGVNSDEAALAKDKLDAQRQETDEANEAADAAQNTANAYREVAQHIVEATKQMEEWVGYMNELGNSAKDLVSSFASDEDAAFFSQQFDSISKAISGTAGLASGIAGAIANPADVSSYVKAIKGVLDIIVGINDYFTGNKIKKAEDNIKSQQQALDDLAYAYDRLENSMKDAFGSDYISKYTQQLEILAAEQKAYEEQARAERDKGKKADEDKIKEYENKARDTANEIAEMQGQLAEYFTGTDVTSAARDFANAWIEAYREFGSTTDAMKEKFQDMIQNMITESLAAKLMQSILEPLFQEIDDLAEAGGELSAADIAKIASDSTGYIDRINAAMTTLMNQLTAAGYNVRDKAGQFTGIARDIAGASEESITGLAAGINTQNFYMMHIDQQVAAILATLTGGSVATADGSQVVLDPYKEQMLAYAAYLPMMHDNVAAMRSLLDKVIRPIGTSSNYRMIIG